MTDPALAALQSALGAEHEAVFGYALLGARLTGAARDLAARCSDEHEAIRDAVVAALSAAGQTPQGPDADYPQLYPVRDAAAALRVAVRIESRCADAWRAAYAAAPRGTRADAQQRLIAAAVRATRWRARIDPARATVPFPDR